MLLAKSSFEDVTSAVRLPPLALWLPFFHIIPPPKSPPPMLQNVGIDGRRHHDFALSPIEREIQCKLDSLTLQCWKYFMDLGTYNLSQFCMPMVPCGNDLATTIFQYPAFTVVRRKKSHSFNTTTASGVGCHTLWLRWSVHCVIMRLFSNSPTGIDLKICGQYCCV